MHAAVAMAEFQVSPPQHFYITFLKGIHHLDRELFPDFLVFDFNEP